jgi:hypothetical protein
MTEAFDIAEKILQDKGLSLTDADVEMIRDLSLGFSFEEKVNGGQDMINRTIEQIRLEPDSKLSADGES